MDSERLFGLFCLVLSLAVVAVLFRFAYIREKKKTNPLLQEKKQDIGAIQPVISDTILKSQSEAKLRPQLAASEKLPDALESDADAETEHEDQDEPDEATEEDGAQSGVPILTVDDLRMALDQTGKSQTELAEAIGVSRFYISKILAGKKPFTIDLQVRVKTVLDQWTVDALEPLADGPSPQVNSGP